MTLHAADAGFVRAPADLVYRRLEDIASWAAWWPGVTVRRPAAQTGKQVSWLLELRPAPGRRLRYAVRPHTWRPDVGFHLDVHGDAVGDAEFWLEPTRHGTVVHHLLNVRTRLRPTRFVTDHRRAVRVGLWALKDTLQHEMRTAGGLTP